MQQQVTTYRNPWHNPLLPMYGPAMYETAATPKFYKGYAIYERISGTCWDVVANGVCLTQRAGPRGAREYIDDRIQTADRLAEMSAWCD